MGEIKSTLDLVMERTRHLSLSAEEKSQQQRADFEKLLQGMLQHYAEDALSDDALRDRIAGLQAELKVTNPQLVMRAIFKRIDLNQENERWLHLLVSLAPASHDSLRKILVAYRKQQADILQASERLLLDQLARLHGIKGSAVVPNTEKDTSYQERMAALRNETQTKIEAIPQQIV